MKIPTGDEYMRMLEEIIDREFGSSPDRVEALCPEHGRVVRLVIARRMKQEADEAMRRTLALFFEPSVGIPEKKTERTFPLLVEWLHANAANMTNLGLNAILDDVKYEANRHIWGGQPTVIDLAIRTHAEVDRIPNVGRRTLNDLAACLGFCGLRFGMTREEAEAAYLESKQ